VDDLERQLHASLTENTALLNRMEEQQAQAALERSHMKQQMDDERRR